LGRSVRCGCQAPPGRPHDDRQRRLLYCRAVSLLREGDGEKRLQLQATVTRPWCGPGGYIQVGMRGCEPGGGGATRLLRQRRRSVAPIRRAILSSVCSGGGRDIFCCYPGSLPREGEAPWFVVWFGVARPDGRWQQLAAAAAALSCDLTVCARLVVLAGAWWLAFGGAGGALELCGVLLGGGREGWPCMWRPARPIGLGLGKVWLGGGGCRTCGGPDGEGFLWSFGGGRERKVWKGERT